MNNLEIITQLRKIVGDDNLRLNESMTKHTSLRVGGKADIFINVDSLEKLTKIINLQTNLPITIIGNGSNVLVKDAGIRGIVLKYTANKYKINQYEVEADAGVSNAALSYVLLNEELTGFEFASGIPGTIGGAIYMNAGAYGKEMKDVIKDVTYINLDDKTIHTIDCNDCNFDYRKSVFMEMNVIILKATLIFSKGEKEKIKQEMDVNKEKRLESQPTEFPNAGSTFKRGDGFITAKLIDEAGLKGAQIGGAEVSTKHAGFIINKNNASASDVLQLAEFVQKEVYKKFNKKIELEMRILGE